MPWLKPSIPTSPTLILRVAAKDDLPVPEVDKANNGVLLLTDIPATGATARVRPYDRIDLNDHVTLYLEEPAGNVRWELRENVTSTTQDLLYTIPRSVLAGLLNRTVQLRYTVEFANGGDGQSAPANLRIEDGLTADRPVIEVIRNTRNEDIPNGGNTTYTTLTLSGTAARDERVLIFDDGNPTPLGIANVNGTGRWSLQVSGLASGAHTFTAEGLYGDFPVSEPYALRITLSGQLLVMGGRSASRRQFQKGVNATIIEFRRLHALNAITRKRISALWRYEHEAVGTGVTTMEFRDSQPDARLYVSTDDDQVILQARNILGNGFDTGSDQGGAFVAWRDQGNLVAWGSPATGGNTGGTIPGLTDIIRVTANRYAFAAVRGNGTGNNQGAVIAWGEATSGGNLPAEIAGLTDIVEVTGSLSAFAARRATGQVVAWGNPSYGGSFPEGSFIPGLNDISEVIGNYRAFAARRENGSVVAWGPSTQGGTVPDDIAQMTNIIEVIPATEAFAARRANGKVVAWGSSTRGGTVPAAIADLDDIVEVIGGTWAFVARRENGKIVAWGSPTYGGSMPADIADLDDIVEVVSSGVNFAALRKNGKVVLWPNENGDDLPADIGNLDDIVQVIGRYVAWAFRRANGMVASMGNSAVLPDDIASLTDIVDVVANPHAFAALRSNGQVVAWGPPNLGGQIPASTVPLLTNVRAIYANLCAFAALTEDGRVVVWGHGTWGGANTSVPSNLNGNISYELKAGITQDDGPCIGPTKTPRKRGKKLPT